MPVARSWVIALAALAACGLLGACEKKESAPKKAAPTSTVDAANAPRAAADAAPRSAPLDAAPAAAGAIDAGAPAKVDEPRTVDVGKNPPPKKKDVPPGPVPDAGTSAPEEDQTTTTTTTSTSTTGKKPGKPKLGGGSGCGDDGDCPKGLTCVKYFGVAGPRGPEFSSCERTCDGGKGCPAGTSCVQISDGPGQVCR